jgi:hypothetical protein
VEERKTLRLFATAEEAEEAEREFYRSLTPQQRLDLTLELCARRYHAEYAQGLARVYRFIEREGR